jgi:acetylornithine deacetylase/succinyl-diaminopimelate desuccinylase-like protein
MTAVDWRAYFAEREAQDLAEFDEFLRIPSISTMPEYAGDVRKAAEWVVARMRKAGIPEVELLETGGHPLIYGRWHVDGSKPTVMIYAHYDVQPPDPLDQWVSPPFEPQTRDGKIYARGVADDKGGLFATLLAVEALGKKAGGPPVNLVFFYEGEEESGSPSVTPFLEREAERWACDVVVSADGLMWDEDNYSLTLSSKGMAGGQIDIFTADIDAHSGIYGATVHNAADVTARIAASFHDANGKIAVQGFYDEVLPVTEQQVAEIEAVPFDENEFLGRLGAKATWGEPDYSTLERAWLRPTLDINGIWSGYLGDGGKTVTPSQGHIKITCRLVPDQDPQAIIELIRMHVQTHLPAGCRAEFQFKIGTAQPFSIARDNPFLVAAEETLRELAGKDPVYGRTGGTIPIAEVFKKHLDAEMVFFSFALEACNAHAPNEWLRLQDFRTGPVATITYLEKMAEIPAEAYR